MILGRTRRDAVKVPRDILNNHYGPQIDVWKADVLYLQYGLPANWITATVAGPHMDDGYTDVLFVTLSLRDRYEFGGEWMRDVKTDYDNWDFCAGRGTFFLIDPARLHWGMPRNFGVDTLRPRRWWGLQWDVPINPDTETVVRGIVEAYGGSWLANQVHFEKVMAHKRKQVRRDAEEFPERCRA